MSGAGRLALVTGANGFVGQATCAALRDGGWRVRGAVRSIGAALPDGVERVLVPSLVDGDDVRHAVADADAVIHLAARVHVMEDTSADPLAEFRAVNVEGTRALARAAASAGVRRFVYASSVKVHGERSGARPLRADDALAGDDPYGVSKREAEAAVTALGRETGMETVIVRPPLVYGPGVRANFLSLLRAVDRGLPLPLGLVRNARSLVFVGNLARFLVLCAEHPAAAGEAFLVADAGPLSTAELARAMARALGRKSRLIPIPPMLMRAGAALLGKRAVVDRLVDSLVLDTTPAAERLGWNPPFTTADGLAETARWFRAAGQE